MARELIDGATAPSPAAPIYQNLIVRTRTGDGHTSVFTSECVRSAAQAFLIEHRAATNQACQS
jgi:hypothetical protein